MSDTNLIVNGALVPAEPAAADPRQQLQQSLGAGAFLTGIDQSEAEGKFRVAEILLGKGEAVEEWINKEFAVCNYLLTHATFMDETSGEEVTTVVSRVVMESGTWIETHSSGVLKTLGMLVQLFGPAPWVPGIPVRLVRRAIRGGKSWCVLELVRPAAQAIADKKKGGKV